MRYTLSFVTFGIAILCSSPLVTEIVAKSVIDTDANLVKASRETTISLDNDINGADNSVTSGIPKFRTTSVLTDMEYQLFIESLKGVNDTICRNDLNVTLNGIQTGQLWAISMYDAMAKSSFGIENGVLHHFGHFDECLEQYKLPSVEIDDVPVRSKYCLTDVTVAGLTVINIDTRAQKQTKTVVHFGACVPSSCSGSDLEHFLSVFLQQTVTVDDQRCQIHQNTYAVTDGMIVYVVIILLFVFLAILSTMYHIYLLTRSDEKPKKSTLKGELITIALLSFSIIENTKKIFKASNEQLGLNSINGMKSIAMLLILFGHAVSFIFGGPNYNTGFLSEQTRKPTFEFLSNSLLFVDVFLLLSGFLFCRILLLELERRRGKLNVLILYVGRYIRLTPAYMAIIGFYMTWFVQIGNGPVWKDRMLLEQERCRESWWVNALYINNYIQTDKLCMFQSWYLCVDSQMFFVSPIAIYLLYKNRKHGLRFLVAMIMLTAIVPFVTTYVQKLDPTLLIYADEMTDLASNSFYVGSYIKTHIRASAYLLGLLTGYCVNIMKEKRIKLPAYIVRLAWFLSFVIGIASMFSLNRFYVAPYSNLESTLYAGFHKVGWNLSVAWLIIATTTGHAGWLETALSSRIFAPLSRLTYCAYLSNGIVELYHASSIRTPAHLSYLNVTNTCISHVIDTFVLAFLLCLLFESPIHALERLLLKNYGRRNQSPKDQQKSNSQSPSTSEEQVA